MEIFRHSCFKTEPVLSRKLHLFAILFLSLVVYLEALCIFCVKMTIFILQVVQYNR